MQSPIQKHCPEGFRFGLNLLPDAACFTDVESAKLWAAKVLRERLEDLVVVAGAYTGFLSGGEGKSRAYLLVPDGFMIFRKIREDG